MRSCKARLGRACAAFNTRSPAPLRPRPCALIGSLGIIDVDAANQEEDEEEGEERGQGDAAALQLPAGVRPLRH